MAAPDPDYRPNPLRAIHVCGEFNQELAAQSLLTIASYRHANNEPITVYINSPGGSTRVLETIECALRCEDQDKKSCRIITVAIGDAGSAAATLLTLGNYAISYPKSVIHFHGARYSEVEVTMEDALSVANRLLALNRKIAHNAAERCVDRLTQRFVQLFPETSKIKKTSKRESVFGKFLRCLETRLSPAAKRVFNKVLQQIGKAEHLTDKVLSSSFNFDRPPLRQDIAVFKALLAYETKVQKNDGFRLDDRAVQNLVADYCLLRDFHMGDHHKRFGSILRMHGPELLKSKDRSHYISKKLSGLAEVKWLDQKTGHLMRAIWHFSVILCRELQSGENGFSASDAYWMGCIDEVYGTDLYGERAVAESGAEQVPENSAPD